MEKDSSEFAAVALTPDRLTPWPRVAAVSAMVSFSLPTFMTGLEVSHGLDPALVPVALILGSVIIFAIGAVMGAVGAMTRMSSYLLVRIAFGDRGASLVNIAFAVSLLGWFGVNINLFTEAAVRLAIDLWQIAVDPVAMALLASVFMTGTTLVGFKAINSLALLMAPVLAVVTLLLLRAALTDQTTALKETATLGFGDGVSAIVGAIIIGAIILPDITRFIRHWSGAVYTALLSYIVVQMLVLFAARAAGRASGDIGVLDMMLTLNLGLGAFLIVITGSWVLNSLNLYSTILSVKATVTGLNSRLLTLALGGTGFLAALLNILDSFVTFLFYLSVIFIPVAGVIVIDFFVIRRAAYRVTTLEANRAYNAPGLIAWAAAAVLALLASQERIPTATGVAVMDAVLLSGVAYGLLARLRVPVWRDKRPR